MAFYARGGNYLPYLQRPRDDWDLPLSRPTGLRRPYSGRRDNGPLLDRDYGDFRPCRRIDSGALIYPRPPSPGFGRKHVMEVRIRVFCSNVLVLLQFVLPNLLYCLNRYMLFQFII